MKSQNGIRHLFTSDLVKNSAKLLSANVVAQAIGLLVYPILTRLYSPEDFGLLSLFLSIGGVLALLATAEYQYAIMLPKEEKQGIACVHIGIFTTLCLTALCTLTIPFSTPIANLFSAPNLAKWWWLMPIFVLVTALWTLLNYWYTRQKCFGQISAYQVTQSSLNALSKIGFGAMRATSFGLIVSSIIAPFVALVANISINFKQQIRRLLHFDRAACREAAKEYANFPKFSLPRALVNNLSSGLPALLLTPFFGLTNLGFWGMGITLAFRPLNMISQSLYQVLFEKVTKQVNSNELVLPLLRRIYLPLLIGFIPLMGLLYIIMPQLVTWLLGAKWLMTATCIRYMLPWLTAVFFVAPLAFVADIFYKQRLFLYIELLYFALRIGAIVIGILEESFLLSIALLSLVGTIIPLLQLGLYIYFLHRYEAGLHRA